MRECMMCGNKFRPWVDTQRVCSPRCAGDLARHEHPDLRSEYRGAVKRIPRPPKSSYSEALASTRAAIDKLSEPPKPSLSFTLAETREAIDMLNGDAKRES